MVRPPSCRRLSRPADLGDLRHPRVPAVGFAAAVGWLLPGLVLARLIERRKKQIQNGLPDALDLLSSASRRAAALDQAIVKASDELEITYPALTEELRMITTEVRAGKPRLEPSRTSRHEPRVDDVQSLVACSYRPTSSARASPGAADARRDLSHQAPAARRGARREGRRQAGVSARAVPVPPRCTSSFSPGGHSIHQRVPQQRRSVTRKTWRMSMDTLTIVLLVAMGLLLLPTWARRRPPQSRGLTTVRTPWPSHSWWSVVATAGCAARGKAASAAPAHATPASTDGAPAGSLHEYIAKVRHVSARLAREHEHCYTLEGRDPSCAALLLVEAARAPSSHMVAGELYRQHSVLDAATGITTPR